MDAPDAHLRAADPVLAGLMDQHGPLPEHPADASRSTADHFGALVRTIAGQQLSVKAAAAIHRRLLDRYGGRTPAPQELLADNPEELRAAAGFSRAKVAYLRSLAEHVLSGELDLAAMDALDDDTVIAQLTAVKGLGEWSAQMILMFHLGRPDVLPTGDLGVRRAMERAYGLAGLPAPDEMRTIAEPWRPHRSRACRWLWRSLHNEPAR